MDEGAQRSAVHQGGAGRAAAGAPDGRGRSATRPRLSATERQRVDAAHDGGLFHSGRHGSAKIPDDHLRAITAVTYGMISFVDQQVGRILDALDRLGLAEDTVVVFTADHGELLGDHWLTRKGPFHVDGLLNVPSIWRYPQLAGPARGDGEAQAVRPDGGEAWAAAAGRGAEQWFPAGRVPDVLVSHLDFAPMILELAGVPVPEVRLGDPQSEVVAPRAPARWPGRLLVLLLAGERDRVQEAVVVENDEDWIGLRLRTLITETHQLTVYIGDDGEQPFGELFDRRADPGQVRNLWHQPGQER